MIGGNPVEPAISELQRTVRYPATIALGALALGAFAIGALAIGALAIGKLVVKRARIGRVEIDELVIRSIEHSEPPGTKPG